jgi:hypothetical protein
MALIPKMNGQMKRHNNHINLTRISRVRFSGLVIARAGYANLYDMMDTMKLGLLHILVGLIIAAILSSCGTDPLTGEESPDKSKIAFAYTKRIGDSNTYISIYYNHNKKEINVLKLKGTVPVSFKWINEKELNVYVPDKSLIEDVNTAFEDIKMNVIEEKK